MHVTSLRAAVAAILMTALGSAGEEESVLDLPPDKDAWPIELVRRPLTLAQGMIELTLPVNASLAPGAFGKPVFFDPSLYYGVTPNVTIGLRHFVGLCVTGSSNGCEDVYRDASLDAIWSLVRGAFTDVAVGAALNATRLSAPFTSSAEIRVAVRYRVGSVAAITLAPQLDVGLSERDRGTSVVGTDETAATGNREVITLPATLEVQATERLAIAVGAALAGPLDPALGGFGDAYAIPVSGEVDYALTNMLDVGANLSYRNLLGKGSTAADRFGKVFVRARF
jgi:hypothetical protein